MAINSRDFCILVPVYQEDLQFGGIHFPSNPQKGLFFTLILESFMNDSESELQLQYTYKRGSVLTELAYKDVAQHFALKSFSAHLAWWKMMIGPNILPEKVHDRCMKGGACQLCYSNKYT